MVLGDAPARRASSKIGELDVDGLLLDSDIIPREALLALSRGDLRNYLTSGSDENRSYVGCVRRLWWALLATMRDSSVADGHMTAACNAICVFLQSASLSATYSIQTFAMSAKIWRAVFDTLLDNFDSGKVKPLRQVLETLIKILGRHKDRTRAQSIQDGVLSRMASVILLGEPVLRFKASIVIFEAFVRSGVPISRLLFVIGRVHGSNRDQWHHRLRRQKIDAIEFLALMERHPVDESITCFSFSIVLAVADSKAQATAGNFFTSFTSMLTAYGVPLGSFQTELVMTALQRYPKAIETFKNYLLPSIFKLHPNHLDLLLRGMASKGAESSMLENTLIIAILGRNAGLLSEQDIATSLHDMLGKGRQAPPERPITNSDETQLYAAILAHPSAGVRTRAYELLATSTEVTKPIRGSSLSLLSKHLIYLHGDSDPAVRGEISGITNAMIRRLRRGSTFHARALANPDIIKQQCAEHKNELREHEDFLDCFINFLESELGPNCSFPRHVSALRELQLLVESGLDPMIRLKVAPKSSHDLPRWPFVRSLHYPSMRSALYHLLLDPFEEVRITATTALKLILHTAEFEVETHSDVTSDERELRPSVDTVPSSVYFEGQQIRSRLSEEIAGLSKAANSLAALTNRADHADGVARLLLLQYIHSSGRSAVVSSILEELDRVLGLSDIKDTLPAKGFSIHGYLLGLKYIVELSGFCHSSDYGMALKDGGVTIRRLLNLSDGVWRAVRLDLCVDSPESSRDEDDTGPFEGPKDFLSYSWRALRDSSLLLQAILLHICSGADTSVSNHRVEHLRTIHALCFEQLTALRHRGAFSTVAQTFAICCEQFAGVPSVRADFRKWRQDAFQILEDQSSRLTRRSAGIPAIMACILIPSTLEEFDGVIGNLASLSRSEQSFFASMTDVQQTHLPQVHVLNCLREILTNSRFRGQTVRWLIEVLDLAASSLSSHVWAIRNCGLMLFRACASRVGTAADVSNLEPNESVSSSQSEAILNIAFKLLKSGRQIDVDCPELSFAGLDLVSRITVPASAHSQTKENVLLQLGSPIWMIREQAARVYASQTPEIEVLGAAVHLISTLALSDQNRSHGILLCARELIQRHLNASVHFRDVESTTLEQALKLHALSIQKFAAAAVYCAFLDIVNDYIALESHSTVQFQTWCLEHLHRIQHSQSPYRSESQFNTGRPFQPRLQTSSALNASLAAIHGGNATAETLYQTFRDTAAQDLDAAAALLQSLKNLETSHQHALRLQVDFYTKVIQDNYDENITAAAMLGLSSCLERVHESKDSLLAEHHPGRLMDSFVSLPYSGCRDLFNARIRGLGSVLAFEPKKWSVWNQHASNSLNLWITMLKSAAKDTTEILTRLNAAKSLHCFRRCLLQDSDAYGVSKKITLYSILYDFLNDDDEEVRGLASSTTSFLLKSAVGGINLQLSPLAACHRLSCYIAERFTSDEGFHLTAFSRLMLPPSVEFYDLESFSAIALRQSVRNQLDAARHETYDLFEQERQNLYVDDVREIDIWYSALGKVSHTLLYDFVDLVGDWAVEGLRELTAALPGLTSGPFGILSKLEIVTLFMRVIRVADLALQWGYSSDWGIATPRKSPYYIEMERMLSATREYPAHPQAQKALEEGFRRGQLAFEELERNWKLSATASED